MELKQLKNMDIHAARNTGRILGLESQDREKFNFPILRIPHFKAIFSTGKLLMIVSKSLVLTPMILLPQLSGHAGKMGD